MWMSSATLLEIAFPVSSVVSSYLIWPVDRSVGWWDVTLEVLKCCCCCWAHDSIVFQLSYILAFVLVIQGQYFDGKYYYYYFSSICLLLLMDWMFQLRVRWLFGCVHRFIDQDAKMAIDYNHISPHLCHCFIISDVVHILAASRQTVTY